MKTRIQAPRSAQQEYNSALSVGREFLAGIVYHLRASVNELAQYVNTYDRAVESGGVTGSPEQALAGAVNCVASNTLGNCRMDLAVLHAARIAATRAAAEAASE